MEDKKSQLVFGDKVIWENSSDIGHFGIKLRKQVYEEKLAQAIMERKRKEENVYKVLNDFTFRSYLARYAIVPVADHPAPRERYEQISAKSDQEALLKAREKEKELNKKNKEGSRCTLQELTKSVMHHRLISLDLQGLCSLKSNYLLRYFAYDNVVVYEDVLSAENDFEAQDQAREKIDALEANIETRGLAVLYRKVYTRG